MRPLVITSHLYAADAAAYRQQWDLAMLTARTMRHPLSVARNLDRAARWRRLLAAALRKHRERLQAEGAL
jgi:hypothetical protein